jgi:hypothetical protein
MGFDRCSTICLQLPIVVIPFTKNVLGEPSEAGMSFVGRRGISLQCKNRVDAAIEERFLVARSAALSE